MSKCHDFIHGVENDGVFKHSIIVELSQIFDFRNPPLVKLEVILLQAETDGFDDIVDYRDGEVRVVAVDGAEEYRENMDAAVLNLARPRENLRENSHNLKGSVRKRMKSGHRVH